MILPIYAYGQPVLREKAQAITADYPELKVLIENMFETMYKANGVGLAAPQIGLAVRLFVIDASPMAEAFPEQKLEQFKQAFINPEKIEEEGEKWPYEEGCLSIPEIREEVRRPARITLQYQDIDFETHTTTFEGMAARIIQHEYDHLEGILFTDYLSSLKKQLLRTRLSRINKGKVSPAYAMKFNQKKR